PAVISAFVVVPRRGVGRRPRDGVDARKPALQVHVGATLGAEGLVLLVSRGAPADGAGRHRFRLRRFARRPPPDRPPPAPAAPAARPAGPPAPPSPAGNAASDRA